MKYSMKCTCGHVMTVDAGTREEAVGKLKTMMTQQALDDHWNQYHMQDTQPKPTVEQSHMMIEQIVVEGVLEEGTGMPPAGQPSTGTGQM